MVNSEGALRVQGNVLPSQYEGNREIREVYVADGNVGKMAFKNCGKLREVVLENTAEIGEEAFACCGKLRIVKIGGNCVKVGEKAFSGCSKLEIVAFPRSLKSIPSSAVPKQARIIVQ